MSLAESDNQSFAEQNFAKNHWNDLCESYTQKLFGRCDSGIGLRVVFETSYLGIVIELLK